MDRPDRDRIPGPRVPAGHALHLCPAAEHRWDTVTAWTLDGLRRGEKVVFTGMQLATSDALTTKLTREGIDVGEVVSSGQLEFAALEDFYPEAGQEVLVSTALAEGFPGVRLSAPAEQALTRMDRGELAAVEARLDELCRRLPLSALCQYDAETLGDDWAAAMVSHPIVTDDIGLVATRVETGWLVAELAGEFDSGNAEVLEAALTRAGRCAADGVTRIELDLSGLRFLGVSGGRALLDGTAAFRRTGGTVCIRGADLNLAQVLALLSLPEHAGIEVEGTAP